MIRTSVLLTEEVMEALRELAKREDRTVGYLVRKAVEEYVKQKEAITNG